MITNKQPNKLINENFDVWKRIPVSGGDCAQASVINPHQQSRAIRELKKITGAANRVWVAVTQPLTGNLATWVSNSKRSESDIRSGSR